MQKQLLIKQKSLRKIIMGCCLKKSQTRNRICPRCGFSFAHDQALQVIDLFYCQFQQHIRQCNANNSNPPQANARQQLYVQQPNNPLQNESQQLIQVQQPQPPPQIQQPQPSRPVIQRSPSLQVQQMQNSLNPGQAVMDDFATNGAQKYYWCKELLPNQTMKYSWVKKLTPSLPEKSIAALLQIPWNTVRTMEFPTKQTWFRLNLEKLRVPWQVGSDSMHVSKESFLMSTLGAVHGVNWHKEVKVIIAGEEKVLDAGGLLREWINLTMKEIMHPESGMFELAETEDATYKMNSDADPVEHVLDCFRLLGIVVGKAIFERIPINAFFDRSIIRHILGQSVAVDDIYFYDKQLYQSWTYLLNNEFDPNELMESFVLYRRHKGDTYDLKPNGAQILVDNDNKHEYVRLCIDYYTYQSVKPFLLAFLNQLYTIVPKKLISVFDPIELEMILYGIPFINLEDWREFTEYKGAYYRGHQTIQWFWQVLADFDQPMLAKFLQFCTGSQRTPVEGFRKLESNRGNCAKFCIESVPFTRANPYPKAHTCFNRLELPIYESYEQINSHIRAIVQNDLDGVFGLE